MLSVIMLSLLHNEATVYKLSVIKNLQLITGEIVTKRIISTTVYYKFKALLHLINFYGVTNCNKIAHIRHQCKKANVLSYHRCLINTGIEKITTFKYRL
jgi:hypothetical protein